MSQYHRKGGRNVPAREPVPGATPSALADLEIDLLDDGDMDFSIEELREFLSADFIDVPVDPAFKDQLRDKLWTLVRSGAFGYGPSED